MTTVDENYFDPETINLLREVLDEAWDNLTPKQAAFTCKTELAQRILKAAANGERDPARLRVSALIDGSASRKAAS